MFDDLRNVALLLLALLVVGLAAYVVVLRLRRPPAPPRALPPTAHVLHAPPTHAAPVEHPDVTRHPIVLAHGFMGFDAIALGTLRQEYFRGVRARLELDGHSVQVVRVSPIAGIRRRAEQLAEQIAAIDAERVNIIAHSMGGLDARYAISKLGLGGRVATLTTIGTPHQGTPLANGAAALDAFGLPRRFMAKLGADLEGFYDLSTERMRTFNATVLDAPEVSYASYCGWLPRGGSVHQLLLPTFTLLHRLVGNNDGIVPASSQQWGHVLGDVAADHWAQIGWSNGFDVERFYAELVRALARRGF